MHKQFLRIALILSLLIPAGVALAEDSTNTATQPTSQSSTQTSLMPQQPSQQQWNQPKNQTQNMPENMMGGQQNMQRDAQNFQKDGSNFQRNGANFQKNSEMMPQSGQNQTGDSGNDQMMSKMQDRQQKQQDAMEKQQQAMAKRMGKQLQIVLNSFAKIQAKLQKSGLSLSSDCQGSISDATTLASALAGGSTDSDQSDVGEAMQSIGQCQMMAQQLSKAPNIYKTLNKMFLKYKKKNPDNEFNSEWDAVDKDFAILKSGTFSQDDIYAFFDDARTLAEDIGIDTSQFGPMPQGIPQGSQGGGMMQQGINQGGAVIKSIGTFFSNLLKKK